MAGINKEARLTDVMERARYALSLRRKGLTLNQIGQKVWRVDGRGPLSHERARQLVAKALRAEKNG